MLIDLTKLAAIQVGDVGGKAFNLHKLIQLGMPVPPAVVVPASVTTATTKPKELREAIIQHEIVAACDNFAVRSSGVGEDGERNSCAGIFESYLDIPGSEVYSAVIRVWNSL